ncbi:NADH-ubiquinone oxidoreductase-F iron-sulfur binding region domain-containing protein [Holophaga foetida]|uniref:NADH-ubiquinone oxidoreductase-F iron-sulfur binding region domain-containing protein n=1 Tax=Holophaga foetida TaxID=35839 RepID=UPI0002475348|nr:NADH-ubiquinone oxidoreductase-F iron-sulfur binding region domain-containing protein [Holophaga foetida]
MPNPVTDFFEALTDRTRTRLAERGDAQKTIIQIGSATCEHAAGSQDVLEEFTKHIQASGRDDVIVHKTGCTGRCSKEPIVGISIPGRPPVKYERVNREIVHKIFTQHIQKGAPLPEHALDNSLDHQYAFEFVFCQGLRCNHLGGLKESFEQLLRQHKIPEDQVRVSTHGCFGTCSEESVGQAAFVLVRPSKVVYRVKDQTDLELILREHIRGGRIVEPLRVTRKPISQDFFDLYADVSFFSAQNRIAMRNSGIVNPESLEEYISLGGFKALATALSKGDPEWVINEVLKARLRGRGGGGFLTGQKWKLATQNEEKTRYIICNGDEGDPGAFMDRGMLESDPFSVMEGMIIGAYAIGACKGFYYIRAEYPLAIKRIQNAIDLCRAAGLLGKSVMGSGWDFDMEIRLGAGAFVCGEETALIRSIEGERGQPKVRPPFPTTRGLWGKPTCINNVETFANITAIINYGGDWFAQVGTEESGGTKVFALAGKVKHTGLVEVPLGTPLRDVVFGIGGGVQDDKALKAIQTGGPAGGFIPASMDTLPVDFGPLAKVGSIMGSGGMIVLSEEDCMVDISKFYLSFTQEESCGKCTPCREGTTRMLEIMERITSGKAVMEDLDKLERLARLCQQTSLCGLGRAAPNPILSSLKHFRDEYTEHIVDKVCRAKKCVALVRYEVSPDLCIGCTVCARNCPTEAISGNRKEVHVIDQNRCVKCGQCYEVCRFDAVERK